MRPYLRMEAIGGAQFIPLDIRPRNVSHTSVRTVNGIGGNDWWRGLKALIWLLVIAVLLAVASCADPEAKTTDPISVTKTRQPSVKVIGREQRVFDWSRDACEPIDIPDQAARAFRDSRGRVQLFASGHTTRRFTGKSLNRLRHSCRVVMPSHYDWRPARFDDHEWLTAPYTSNGKTVYALVHEEYQGSTHPGRCPSSNYFKCWYNAITLAKSTNGGRTFTQRRPPTHLVASIPYRYVPDSGPYGLFSPSNIIRKGRYYYALLGAKRYNLQREGTCLIRTRHLADPKSWRAWGGSGFTVRFLNPYSPRLQDPAEHICEPVSFPQIVGMTQSLTFNTYLRKFLLMSTSQRLVPSKPATGIYYSLSDDLIHWSHRRLLFKATLPPLFRCGDSNPIAYPSVLDPKSRSRNFDTTGRRPYLYYTRFKYKDCRQTMDRDLVRRQIEFRR
jgi:hypothetical protein